MTDEFSSGLTVEEAMAVLRTLMHGSESDPTRLGAAKIVLERMTPKEDEETRRRKAEEHESALFEARAILAEFALAKSAGLHQPVTLDQIGPPAAADAEG